MRINLLTLLFVFGFGSLNAQKVFQPKQINYDLKGIIYQEEKAMGLKIHTNGFALHGTKGEILTYYRTRYYSIEFGILKDSRERRQNKNLSISREGASSSFAYGKQNSFYLIRFGVGEKRYLTEKARRRGLAVGLNYGAGLTLGMLKPYYLEVVSTSETDFETKLNTIRYSEENEGEFLDYENIFGGSGFFNGITNTAFTIGAHGKLGVLFAFGAFDQYVKAFETGIMIDAYTSDVPILVERGDIRNRKLFLNIFMSIHLGKRR